VSIGVGTGPLIGGAGAWPFHARARKPDRIRRIGCLIPADKSDPEFQTWFAAFEKRLQSLGWDIGRNLQIDYRWTTDPDRIGSYAAELVAITPDALIAVTTPAVVALQRETRTIPIVFTGVSDPIGSGFVQSLAHPGGNATGWSNFAPGFSGKYVGLLNEIAPSVGRMVILFNPTTAPYVTGYYMPDLKAAAAAFAVELIIVVVHEANDLEAVVLGIAREPNGGLVVMPDVFTFVHRKLIITLADKYRVPAIYPYRRVCRDGGLESYAPDLAEVYPLIAEYVDRILKGAHPADLPVQAPTRFETAINLKTAKALGLTVPATLLATADEVIE
jgi:putative tryptophan/tyrosine transport system substrate-binding protein